MGSPAEKAAKVLADVSSSAGHDEARREIVEAIGQTAGACLGTCIGALIDGRGPARARYLLSELTEAIVGVMKERPEA